MLNESVNERDSKFIKYSHIIDWLIGGMKQRILSHVEICSSGGQKETGKRSTTCLIFPQSVRGSVCVCVEGEGRTKPFHWYRSESAADEGWHRLTPRSRKWCTTDIMWPRTHASKMVGFFCNHMRRSKEITKAGNGVLHNELTPWSRVFLEKPAVAQQL